MDAEYRSPLVCSELQKSPRSLHHAQGLNIVSTYTTSKANQRVNGIRRAEIQPLSMVWAPG